MVEAVFIVAIVCITTVVLVRIGTSHVECIERIKHGYPVESDILEKKDTVDYRKVKADYEN